MASNRVNTHVQVVADLKFHTECFSCGRCQHFLGEEDNYVLLERHRLVWSWNSLGGVRCCMQSITSI